MAIQSRKHGKSLLYRIVSLAILVCFVFNSILPNPAYAQAIPQALNLPTPGAMLNLSPAFTPTLLKGVKIHPENPLQFNFIVNTGDSNLQGEELKAEGNKLIKYFLAALTVPEEDLWVNLSPYEKNRIIAEGFGQTEMGRDMLAQDYILKQITASLIYPESDLGKKFWDRIYKEAKDKFGTTDVPVDTFNKVWIVPNKALIYENDGTAFVVENSLKVMLEEDYEALRASSRDAESRANAEGGRGITSNNNDKTHALASQIVREIILPAIEREVNEGKNFAPLRQIANSLVLAAWYKQNLRESLLGQVYVDKNKTKGVDIADKDAKLKIYNQYLEAFKKGAYNYIKEEYDPTKQDVIMKKYVSGGTEFQYVKSGRLQVARNLDRQPASLKKKITEAASLAGEAGEVFDFATLAMENSDSAALTAAMIPKESVDAASLGAEEGIQAIDYVDGMLDLAFARNYEWSHASWSTVDEFGGNGHGYRNVLIGWRSERHSDYQRVPEHIKAELLFLAEKFGLTLIGINRDFIRGLEKTKLNGKYEAVGFRHKLLSRGSNSQRGLKKLAARMKEELLKRKEEIFPDPASLIPHVKKIQHDLRVFVRGRFHNRKININTDLQTLLSSRSLEKLYTDIAHRYDLHRPNQDHPKSGYVDRVSLRLKNIKEIADFVRAELIRKNEYTGLGLKGEGDASAFDAASLARSLSEVLIQAKIFIAKHSGKEITVFSGLGESIDRLRLDQYGTDRSGWKNDTILTDSDLKGKIAVVWVSDRWPHRDSKNPYTHKFLVKAKNFDQFVSVLYLSNPRAASALVFEETYDAASLSTENLKKAITSALAVLLAVCGTGGCVSSPKDTRREYETVYDSDIHRVVNEWRILLISQPDLTEDSRVLLERGIEALKKISEALESDQLTPEDRLKIRAHAVNIIKQMGTPSAVIRTVSAEQSTQRSTADSRLLINILLDLIVLLAGDAASLVKFSDIVMRSEVVEGRNTDGKPAIDVRLRFIDGTALSTQIPVQDNADVIAKAIHYIRDVYLRELSVQSLNAPGDLEFAKRYLNVFDPDQRFVGVDKTAYEGALWAVETAIGKAKSLTPEDLERLRSQKVALSAASVRELDITMATGKFDELMSVTPWELRLAISKVIGEKNISGVYHITREPGLDKRVTLEELIAAVQAQGLHVHVDDVELIFEGGYVRIRQTGDGTYEAKIIADADLQFNIQTAIIQALSKAAPKSIHIAEHYADAATLSSENLKKAITSALAVLLAACGTGGCALNPYYKANHPQEIVYFTDLEREVSHWKGIQISREGLSVDARDTLDRGIKALEEINRSLQSDKLSPEDRAKLRAHADGVIRGIKIMVYTGDSASLATPKKIAISGGAGRIGVNTIRAILQSPYNIEIAAINDLAFDLAKSGLEGVKAYVVDLKREYESSPRSRVQDVKFDYGKDEKGFWITIEGQKIRVTDERDLKKLPWNWRALSAVVNATGITALSTQMRENGALQVVESFPDDTLKVNYVAGVNTQEIDLSAVISSCASCTTGSIAPPLKVILDSLGIETFIITTTHSFTADQALKRTLRPGKSQRGQAAAENIVYETTGAAKAIGKVIPELQGKGDGFALRVPTPDGSATVITITTKNKTTKEDVNALLKKASEGPFKGVMAFEARDLISEDILGRSESAIVQGTATRVINGNQVTILSWYDNEFGYSSRMVDFLALVTGADQNVVTGRVVRDVPPVVLEHMAIAQKALGEFARQNEEAVDRAQAEYDEALDAFNKARDARDEKGGENAPSNLIGDYNRTQRSLNAARERLDLLIGKDSATLSDPIRDNTPAQQFIRTVVNPYKTQQLTRLEGLKRIAPVELHDIIDDLQVTEQMNGDWLEVELEDASKQPYSARVYAVRSVNNRYLGPGKGGIRYFSASELKGDKHFMKAWDYLMTLNPTEEDVNDLIERWMDGDSEALALGMTLKTAANDTPLGGGKAAVFIGKIVKNGGAKFSLEDLPQWNSPENADIIADAHGEYLSSRGLVGVNTDIPAPDRNTGGRIMVSYLERELETRIDEIRAVLPDLGEELSTIMGKKTAGLYGKFERPLVKAVDTYSKSHRGVNVEWLGTLTGKPVELGGSQGRDEATGEGIMDIIMAVYKGDIKGKTFAVQGFGNVGTFTVRGILREGGIVTVISDIDGTYKKKDGWTKEDIEALIKARGSIGNNIRKGVISADGIEITEGEGKTAAVLNADVDALIPAAQENVIDLNNVDQILAKKIFEGANGPTTMEASRVLKQRGVEIYPDTLVNARGVYVSYLESFQARTGIWFSLDEVRAKRRKSSLNALVAFERSKREHPGATDHEAWDLVAIKNIKRAKSLSAVHAPIAGLGEDFTGKVEVLNFEDLPADAQARWKNHKKVFKITNTVDVDGEKEDYVSYVAINEYSYHPAPLRLKLVHGFYKAHKNDDPWVRLAWTIRKMWAGQWTLGGTRIKNYPNQVEAIKDELNLSRGMATKSALSVPFFGGGKVVINVGFNPKFESNKAKKQAVQKDVARVLNQLQIILTAVDMNTTDEDVFEMAQVGSNTMIGLNNIEYGGVVASPETAKGVIKGNRRFVELKRFNGVKQEFPLQGLTYGVQGAGGVGGVVLEKLLREEKVGKAYVTDVFLNPNDKEYYDPKKEAEFKEKYKEEIAQNRLVILTDPDSIYDMKMDVFSPNAIGGILNEANIMRLLKTNPRQDDNGKTDLIIAGAANNQLSTVQMGELLHQLGFLYAPDYVINAGGLTAVEVDLVGFELEENLDRIPANLEKIYVISQRDNLATSVVAEKLAQERLDLMSKYIVTEEDSHIVDEMRMLSFASSIDDLPQEKIDELVASDLRFWINEIIRRNAIIAEINTKAGIVPAEFEDVYEDIGKLNVRYVRAIMNQNNVDEEDLSEILMKVVARHQALKALISAATTSDIQDAQQSLAKAESDLNELYAGLKPSGDSAALSRLQLRSALLEKFVDLYGDETLSRGLADKSTAILDTVNVLLRQLGLRPISYEEISRPVTRAVREGLEKKGESPIPAVKVSKKARKDAASLQLAPDQEVRPTPVGGINFNPSLLDLQIKRDGQGIPLPLPQQPVGDMKIEGFAPFIINITPITNLPLMLGILDTEPAIEVSRRKS